MGNIGDYWAIPFAIAVLIISWSRVMRRVTGKKAENPILQKIIVVIAVIVMVIMLLQDALV